jgi:hypothetical protein
LLLQHLRNHKSKSIHKPALPLNPFRHRFLLRQARSENFWNFVATKKSVSWQLLMNMRWQNFTRFFRWPIFFFTFYSTPCLSFSRLTFRFPFHTLVA